MLQTIRYILRHPISGKHPLSALARYFRWQIGSRLLRYPVAVPFIGKTHLVAEPSMTGATGNIYCGLHEFHDMAFVLHFLRPEDLFVDIGANIGSYSVLAAGVVGCKVICFEPVPGTFELLERNVYFNRLQDRITRRRCAVGSSEGELRFSSDLDTMNRVVGDDYHGNSILVPIDSLDRLLGGFRPSLWKIDVEGFEEAVLAGAENAIGCESLLAILIEGNTPEVRRRLDQAGFVAATYDPALRKLHHRDTSSSLAGSLHNQLWIRRPSFEEVATRCREANPLRFTAVDFDATLLC